MYNLIDNNYKMEIKKFYKIYCVTVPIIFLLLGVISICFWINNEGALVNPIFVMDCIITILMVFLLFIGRKVEKRRYGLKLSYENGCISIYNYKNDKVKEILLSKLKTCNLKVKFDEVGGLYRNFIIYDCLIIYDDFEVFDNMEYYSYWNEPNLAIIQNVETIEFVERIIKQYNLEGKEDN